MAKRTQKAGYAGRYGARYGVKLRRRVNEVEARQRGRHECPSCAALALRRTSTGVWACKKCGHKYAGGAYYPQTPAHAAAQRTIRDSLDELAEGGSGA